MYRRQENIFYYLTLYNENYRMPAIPENPALPEQIIKGIYCLREADPGRKQKRRIHILASGVMVQQALRAAELLEQFELAANIWSVTSYSELYRDAVSCERVNRLRPESRQQTPYLLELFTDPDDIFVATSDYLKALPNSIRPWIPGPLTALGTDGYGLSESREALRGFFEVSPEHLAYAALESLFRQGELTRKRLLNARSVLAIDPDLPDPALR